MSTRKIKLLLPLFFIQIVLGQNNPHLKTCRSTLSDLSLNTNTPPCGNNLPVTNNIPFINTPSLNGLGFPNLPFINGKFNDLINLASTVNGLGVGDNSLSVIKNTALNNNNNLQIPGNNGLAFNNMPQVWNSPLASNLPLGNNLPVNNNWPNMNYDPEVNNLLSNLQSNVISANNQLSRNVPVNENPITHNNLYFNGLPDINSVNSALPKIKSLTLAGQAFNNGLPFNVMSAQVLNNEINDVPINNYLSYNNGLNSGIKIPRSLPAIEMSDDGFPVPNNVFFSHNTIENSDIGAPQIIGSDVPNSISNNIPQSQFLGGFAVNNVFPPNYGLPVHNSMPTNNGLPVNQGCSVNNGMPVDNGIPVNHGFSVNIGLPDIVYNPGVTNTNNIPTAFPINDGSHFIGTPVNNGNLPIASNLNKIPADFSSCGGNTATEIHKNNGIPNIGTNNFNNIQSNNEQFFSTYNQIPTERLQHSSHIQNYQHTESPIVSNVQHLQGFCQTTGNNLNLPDLGNSGMFSLGEFGNFPILSGLPVIGITETITVINPDNLYHNYNLG